MKRPGRTQERLRIFAERYALHRNATEAAIEAASAVGVKIPNRNAAGVWAKRNIDLPEVQARIKEIAEALSAKAAKDAETSKAATIADVTEALGVLTAQMRGTKPWRVRRSKSSYMSGGTMVEATQETAVLEPGLAASRILDHYDGTGAPPDSGRLGEIRASVLVVLADPMKRRAFDQIAAGVVESVPRETIRTPAAAAHSGNGNGNNGHGG